MTPQDIVAELKHNLHTLQDMHQRLKYMLLELEELMRD